MDQVMWMNQFMDQVLRNKFIHGPVMWNKLIQGSSNVKWITHRIKYYEMN